MIIINNEYKNVIVELKRLEQFHCHECDVEDFDVCDACEINHRMVEIQAIINSIKNNE